MGIQSKSFSFPFILHTVFVIPETWSRWGYYYRPRQTWVHDSKTRNVRDEQLILLQWQNFRVCSFPSCWNSTWSPCLLATSSAKFSVKYARGGGQK